MTDLTARSEAVDLMVEKYAREQGFPNISIVWGQIRAKNALKDGRSAWYAVEVGKTASREFGLIFEGLTL